MFYDALGAYSVVLHEYSHRYDRDVHYGSSRRWQVAQNDNHKSVRQRGIDDDDDAWRGRLPHRCQGAVEGDSSFTPVETCPDIIRHQRAVCDDEVYPKGSPNPFRRFNEDCNDAREGSSVAGEGSTLVGHSYYTNEGVVDGGWLHGSAQVPSAADDHDGEREWTSRIIRDPAGGYWAPASLADQVSYLSEI